MKIVCIYPVDETTEFLRPIYDALSEFPSFTGFDFINDEKDVEAVLHTINACDTYDYIIFLGHGSSNCLYNVNKTHLIGNNEFSIFQNKRMFLLACRSSEFISKNDNITPKEYIGFGDMLTDWSEVVTERDAENNAYPGIDEDIILEYRKILTEIISDSLVKAIKMLENNNSLYLRIKLYFNKKIASLLMQKTYPGYRVLANLLYETKKEMVAG